MPDRIPPPDYGHEDNSAHDRMPVQNERDPKQAIRNEGADVRHESAERDHRQNEDPERIRRRISKAHGQRPHVRQREPCEKTARRPAEYPGKQRDCKGGHLRRQRFMRLARPLLPTGAIVWILVAIIDVIVLLPRVGTVVGHRAPHAIQSVQHRVDQSVQTAARARGLLFELLVEVFIVSLVRKAQRILDHER